MKRLASGRLKQNSTAPLFCSGTPGNTGRGGRFRSPGQRVRLTGAQAVSLRPVPQGATGADVGLVGRRCLDGCQKAALFCALYHQRISAARDGGVPK